MTINKLSQAISFRPACTRPHAQLTAYYCFLVITFSIGIRVFFMLFNDLLVEEAYYWNYSAHLDFGYLDHPPMVALLIKAAELIFGYSVWAVRIPTLFCWVLTAWFVKKLTQLMAPEVEGYWPILLLSLLPFFFLQSLVITPDAPMLVSWAAVLYYLYRCLVQKESKAWYGVGVWFGIGMLSKYTISLLALPILVYVGSLPETRKWFLCKEPYLAVIIALFFFSPVIYWNASHQWVSFLFQSARRLENEHAFTLHQVLSLLVLFLTPIGIMALYQLIHPFKDRCHGSFSKQGILFIKFFTLVPIGFFALYSVRHPVKFNWIGPSLLALIPWMAYCVRQCFQTDGNALLRSWSRRTIVASVMIYWSMLLIVSTGKPHILYRVLFTKFIGWEQLARDFHRVADDIAIHTHDTPSFVPLDRYNIASELSYYQQHWVNCGDSQTTVYPVIGPHLFGIESLMFRYWDSATHVAGEHLILISPELSDFANTTLKDSVVTRGPMKIIWAYSQRGHNPVRPYYYQWVQRI